MFRPSLLLFSAFICILIPASILQAETAKPAVLFDQGHSEVFVIEKEGGLNLSELAGLFREGGWDVRSTNQPLSAESLTGIDALVISGPFAQFIPSEADAIKAFAERGGRVAIMLHIAPPLKPILDLLGVATTNGSVHEVENVIGGDGKDFRVTRLEPHPITKGLSGFAVYGTWGLMTTGDNVRITAMTGPQAWVDHNKDKKFSAGDASGEFGIIVTGRIGRGEYAVFGDDAIFQNKYLKDENTLLGKNLQAWLKGRR